MLVVLFHRSTAIDALTALVRIAVELLELQPLAVAGTCQKAAGPCSTVHLVLVALALASPWP